MKTIVIDNVDKVTYLDGLAKGHLNGINVVFASPPGNIATFFGPGLRLALDLLRDQFPPTEAERIFVDRPVATPIDFDIDPKTLVISARPDKLKGLQYKHLMAANEQAEAFGNFRAGGRSFSTDKLREAVQPEIERKKP